MKVAVCLGRDREVMIDTLTNELIVRTLPVDGTEKVYRVSMDAVLIGKAKADAFSGKRASVNKKRT